eukprot:scaffold4349_cov258-Pinguiococcus_pyrenoidosus.AAC.4
MERRSGEREMQHLVTLGIFEVRICPEADFFLDAKLRSFGTQVPPRNPRRQAKVALLILKQQVLVKSYLDVQTTPRESYARRGLLQNGENRHNKRRNTQQTAI